MITVLVIEDDYSTRLVTKLHLKNEYNVDIVNTPLPYQYIRWIKNKEIDLKKLRKQIWSLQM